MNRQKISAFVAVLLLVGSAGTFIIRLKSRQAQGKPGLKLVQRPSFNEQNQPVGSVSVDLPERILDYTSTNFPIAAIELRTLPKDTIFGRRGYTNEAGFWSRISVVLMGADRTSIHKPEICLTGQGWKIDKAELITIPIDRPHRYELSAMKMTASLPGTRPDGRADNYRATYIYWFVSANRLTPQHKERMWGTVEDLIKTGVLPRWAYVSCLSVCWPEKEEVTYREMLRLLAAAVPEFQITVPPPLEVANAATARAQ